MSRIAVLTNDYPPKIRGGAGRIAETQVHLLQGAGHEVRVWYPEVAWLRSSPLRRLFAHLKDLGSRPEISDEIIDWKPDLLITHNLTGCGFSTPCHIQKSGTRWIHFLHDVQLFEPSGQCHDASHITRWQRFWSHLRRVMFGNPHAVVSPTRWLMAAHQARGFFSKTQREILPNPAPSIHRTERRLHDPIRLLFVGRVTFEKGGKMLEKVTQATGWPIQKIYGVGSAEVLEKMREADVLLVPSQIEENQPTVILEAASMGLPVIASNKDGIIETLAGAGPVVPSDDVSAWVLAITKLVQDPLVYNDAVQRMLELAKDHDPDKYTQRFLSLVNSNR